MNNPKAILYDLAIAGIAVTGWLIPSSAKLDLVKALSISTSLIFSGRAYCTGVMLLSQERKNDEKDAMEYDATLDFHERLLESSLELKLQQLENRFTEYLIPLAQRKNQLEKQLSRVLPEPELTEEDREQAAKDAIEGAFDDAHDRSEISEEQIREKYPESLDSTTWKAICKALGNGASKEEILKDVLTDCTELGKGYYELLKSKYL